MVVKSLYGNPSTPVYSFHFLPSRHPTPAGLANHSRSFASKATPRTSRGHQLCAPSTGFGRSQGPQGWPRNNPSLAATAIRPSAATATCRTSLSEPSKLFNGSTGANPGFTSSKSPDRVPSSTVARPATSSTASDRRSSIECAAAGSATTFSAVSPLTKRRPSADATKTSPPARGANSFDRPGDRFDCCPSPAVEASQAVRRPDENIACRQGRDTVNVVTRESVCNCEDRANLCFDLAFSDALPPRLGRRRRSRGTNSANHRQHQRDAAESHAPVFAL